MFLFEHDLFGKPVPTFPDHARRNSADRKVALGIMIPPALRRPK
jgi:hypothetical protein